MPGVEQFMCSFLCGLESSHVMQLLLELNSEQGATLVLVTHDRELAAHADRKIHLKDGKIIQDT